MENKPVDPPPACAGCKLATGAAARRETEPQSSPVRHSGTPASQRARRVLSLPRIPTPEPSQGAPALTCAFFSEGGSLENPHLAG